LRGEHRIGFLDAELEWYLNTSIALRNQPDTRATRYTKDGLFEQSRNMIRYFNNHNENLFQAAGALRTICRRYQTWHSLPRRFLSLVSR
jgi:hypothetical protein